MLPVVLAGTIPLPRGLLSGVAAHFKRRKRSWFDLAGCPWGHQYAGVVAFGKCSRMPLARRWAMELWNSGAGKLQAESGAAEYLLVGIRDLDTQEKKLAKEVRVHVFTMRDIDERGMREVMSDG